MATSNPNPSTPGWRFRPLLAPPDATTLDPGACLELLMTARSGRLALSVAALPAIVPVTFSVRDDELAFASDPIGALGAMDGAVVAFQADQLDDTVSSGWSVHIVGVGRREGDDASPSYLLAPSVVDGWQLSGP